VMDFGEKKPCDLYRSPSTVRMVKPRRLQLVPHVARIGETRANGVFVAKCLKISTWNQGDGRITLRLILEG
jgi:hypothetical protein